MHVNVPCIFGRPTARQQRCFSAIFKKKGKPFAFLKTIRKKPEAFSSIRTAMPRRKGRFPKEKRPGAQSLLPGLFRKNPPQCLRRKLAARILPDRCLVGKLKQPEQEQEQTRRRQQRQQYAAMPAQPIGYAFAPGIRPALSGQAMPVVMVMVVPAAFEQRRMTTGGGIRFRFHSDR